MTSLPQPRGHSNILYEFTQLVILGLCPGSRPGLESHIKMGHHKAWELLPSASRTRYELCYGRRDDIENDNKKGTIRPTANQSHRILLGFALFKSHHHAKVPKKETGQTPSLALIVAGTEVNPWSHQCDLHILHLLSCPSVGLCGWWGCRPNGPQLAIWGVRSLSWGLWESWWLSMKAVFIGWRRPGEELGAPLIWTWVRAAGRLVIQRQWRQGCVRLGGWRDLNISCPWSVAILRGWELFH